MAGHHYLYACQSQYSRAVKVGRYIADLKDLRGRYVTFYGRDMDLVVFQLIDKAAAIQAEAEMHRTLKAAGYHLTGELFDEACMDLFMSHAAAICQDVVDVKEARSTKRRREEKECRRNDRQRQRQEEHAKALEGVRELTAAVEQGLDTVIQRDCTLGKKLAVNAAAFRQSVMREIGKKVSQKCLRQSMARRGFPFQNLRVNGVRSKAYTGLSPCVISE